MGFAVCAVISLCNLGAGFVAGPSKSIFEAGVGYGGLCASLGSLCRVRGFVLDEQQLANAALATDTDAVSLPPGWQNCKDPASGKTFYGKLNANGTEWEKTQWDHPKAKVTPGTQEVPTGTGGLSSGMSS